MAGRRYAVGDPPAEPTTAPQTVDVAPADPEPLRRHGRGWRAGTAEPGWVGPTAEPAKGRSLIKKLAIPVVILVVVVGAVVFRDRLSGSSSDLVVGDCFDALSSASAPTSGVEVGDVQHHPCSEAHGFEVFAVLKHPGRKGRPYPGTETLFTYADTNCLPPFATYVGIEFAESTSARARSSRSRKAGRAANGRSPAMSATLTNRR
jgi:hypothetical protein